MGYITMAMLGLTAFFMFFGFILGLLRGFNRSFLRLILVLASFVAAIALRSTFASIIMNLDVGGETLAQSIASGIGDSLPSALQDIIFVLLEIVIGFAGYFVIFVGLLIITWLIVFPICKIFVKKGIRRRRFLGGLVGLLQGFVIAFAFCAPITGLVAQADKITKIEIDGSPIIELPEEIGISDYLESAPGKLYNKTGNWLFEILSSGKTADGQKIAISDLADIVGTVGKIATAMTDLTDSLDIMSNPDATPQEKVSAMKDLGNVLMNIDSSIDGLSGQAKEMINGVVNSAKEMLTPEGEELDPAIEDAINNFDISTIDLGSAGQAITGISTYIEKTDESFSNSEPVTQAEVDMIVNGIAGCDIIFASMTEGDQVDAILEVDESHKAMFENSINSNTSLSDADKAKMKDLFGLNA